MIRNGTKISLKSRKSWYFYDFKIRFAPSHFKIWTIWVERLENLSPNSVTPIKKSYSNFQIKSPKVSGVKK